MLQEHLVNLAYLVASVCFMFGLKLLAHPRTAVRANLVGATGMLIAVVAVMTSAGLDYRWVIVGLAIGSIVGLIFALRVPMTGMPQMVALLNGFGGIASLLVGGGALYVEPLTHRTPAFMIATVASGIIGAVTFTGSLVAFDKLQEFLLKGKPIVLPFRHGINATMAIAALGLGGWLISQPDSEYIYLILSAVCLVLGVLLVIPIGGADMPVVIALLNSYSGMAACATGFVLQNTVLIIAGSLVGASGIILTQIMCRAMNRSMTNVIFAAVGAAAEDKSKTDDIYAGKIKSVSAEEVAMIFEGVQKVIIVPGYGMAVAQAQHAVAELAEKLEASGAEVLYAIHPVAGRMPGHMNVLLAEADVPYDKLKEMDEINPMFQQTDVALVIGANDTVNPIARTDPKSPIAGMPILDVDKARNVVVVKRSLSPGFAGIPNPLFAADNTLMYFADGKQAVLDLIKAMDEMK